MADSKARIAYRLWLGANCFAIGDTQFAILELQFAHTAIIARGIGTVNEKRAIETLRKTRYNYFES